MKSQSKFFTIVIPTKNRGQIFDETLKCAFNASKELNGEIIVVNDSKLLKPIIPTEYDNVRLVDNQKSGVSSARNYGATLSTTEIIIFMDDDILITKDSLAKAIEVNMKDSKRIYLFNWVYPPALEINLSNFQFGRYLRKFGFNTLRGWIGAEWSDKVDQFQLTGGSSQFLIINKKLFFEIGAYNETFPHAGAEDFDFFKRAIKHGIKFYLDKNYTLYHNEQDRLNLLNWLERKRRNGETLRVASELGYSELSLHYNIYKRVVLTMLSKVKYVFFFLQKITPNNPKLDPIYFRLTNILLAIFIFDGYHKTIK